MDEIFQLQLYTWYTNITLKDQIGTPSWFKWKANKQLLPFKQFHEHSVPVVQPSALSWFIQKIFLLVGSEESVLPVSVFFCCCNL